MRLFVKSVSLLTCVCLFAGADWRGFRGTDGTAVAPDDPVPTEWDGGDMIAWQVDLPGRGLSSPIIVGDRVLVTASSGYRQDRLHVLCFDAADGQLAWERQFWPTGRTMTHPTTCVAAPTPTSDGERVFATYSTNDVACLDLEGNLLWYRGLTHDYPNASNSLGMASSPVVADETLAVMVENDSESFTTGLDAATGEQRWKLDRPRRANWTTPVVLPGADPGEERVLVQSSAGVAAVVPRTGEIAWTYGDGASTTASLVVAAGTAYVPSHGITAIRPGATTPEVAEIVWQSAKLSPQFASPLWFDGSVFVINDPNVLVRADSQSGETQWQLRLEGNFFSSPVAAGGHLFAFSHEGVGFVVDLSGRGRIVARHEFGEPILGTPSVANGALYVRSDGRLWKIAAE
jgi:outer membrane protein assembly factor BamB